MTNTAMRAIKGGQPFLWLFACFAMNSCASLDEMPVWAMQSRYDHHVDAAFRATPSTGCNHAEEHMIKALEIAEDYKILAPDNPNADRVVIEAHRSMGTILSDICQNKGEAVPYYEAALAMSEKAFGLIDLDVAYSLNNLGRTYRDLGDFEKAEALLLRASGIIDATTTWDWRSALPYYNLAELYRSQGKTNKAETYYQMALHQIEFAYLDGSASQSQARYVFDRYASLLTKLERLRDVETLESRFRRLTNSLEKPQ